MSSIVHLIKFSNHIHHLDLTINNMSDDTNIDDYPSLELGFSLSPEQEVSSNLRFDVILETQINAFI